MIIKLLDIRLRYQISWAQNGTKKYDYFKADFNAIRMYAKSRNLFVSSSVDNDSNVEESWRNIRTGIIEIRNKFVKLKAKNKERCKWATKKVTNRRKAKKTAWNLYKCSSHDPAKRDPALYNIYQKKLKKSVTENRRAKANFEEKLANNIKSNTKSFFAYANSKRKINKKIGPLKDDSKKVIENNKCAADHLNRYFVSVFVEEDLSNMPVPNKMFNGSDDETLQNIEVDDDLMINKLNSLNASKSQGPDEVHGKFVMLVMELSQEIAPAMLGPL